MQPGGGDDLLRGRWYCVLITPPIADVNVVACSHSIGVSTWTWKGTTFLTIGRPRLANTKPHLANNLARGLTAEEKACP
jgi:hypothetical protein